MQWPMLIDQFAYQLCVTKWKKNNERQKQLISILSQSLEKFNWKISISNFN